MFLPKIMIGRFSTFRMQSVVKYLPIPLLPYVAIFPDRQDRQDLRGKPVDNFLLHYPYLQVRLLQSLLAILPIPAMDIPLTLVHQPHWFSIHQKPLLLLPYLKINAAPTKLILVSLKMSTVVLSNYQTCQLLVQVVHIQ